MSTLVTGTIKSNTSNPPLFQNTSGTEIGTLCRAWVNFNGTGTVAIRASYNVSSITDGGTGIYTVNLSNALVDSNYCCTTTSGPLLGVTDLAWARATPTTSSAIAVYCFYKTDTNTTSNTTFDPATVLISVFR